MNTGQHLYLIKCRPALNCICNLIYRPAYFCIGHFTSWKLLVAMAATQVAPLRKMPLQEEVIAFILHPDPLDCQPGSSLSLTALSRQAIPGKIFAAIQHSFELSKKLPLHLPRILFHISPPFL